MTTSRANPPLVLSAQDRDRVEQVEALARRGRSGIAALVPLLDDPSWAVRRAVTSAFARLGDDAIEPLCEILRSRRDNEARIAATVDALATSSGNVLTAMMALASAGSPPVICDALQVLGRRKEREALPLIVDLAAHQDDNVAVASIEALGRIGGVSTVEPLLDAVRKKNFFRTFPAIEALGRTRDPRAIEPLVALLSDPLYAAEATRALGRTGQAAAATALAPILSRGNDAMVRTAALALSDLGDHYDVAGSARSMAQALRASLTTSVASIRLSACVQGATPSERVAMIRVLGWLGDELAITRLIQLLDEEPTIAQAAGTALRAIGPEATPHLLTALRAADSARRLLLLPLLGVANAVVDDLVACLDDPDSSVRALACDALARAGNTAVVPALFRLLSDPDARVSQAAAGAVQSLGSLETKRLALQQARSGDARARRAALRIVSYFGYPDGLDVLVEAMDDNDERIREVAIAGLPLMDDPRAPEALLSAAIHANVKTRAAAVRALGNTSHSPPIVERLRAALSDGDPWVRYYACQSLAKLRVVDAIPEIAARMSDEAGQVRVAAIEALSHLKGPLALEALSRAATSDDLDMRRASLLGLGTMRDASTLPLLRAAAQVEDAPTRLVAISALAEFDLPDVVPILAHAMSDPRESVSSAAIGYLSTRPGEAATKALVEQLGNAALRESVIAALAVAPEGRTETLLSILEAADEPLAAMLVTALVRMRRPSAVAAIAALLTFENVHARRAAASALAAVGTREALDALRRVALSDLDGEVRRTAAAATRDG